MYKHSWSSCIINSYCMYKIPPDSVFYPTIDILTKFRSHGSYIQQPNYTHYRAHYPVFHYSSPVLHSSSSANFYVLPISMNSWPTPRQKKKRKCYEMYWDSGTEKKKRVKLGYSIKSFTTHPTYLKFRVGLNTNCKLLKKWWGRAPVSVKFCCFVWQLLWRSRAILK